MRLGLGIRLVVGVGLELEARFGAGTGIMDKFGTGGRRGLGVIARGGLWYRFKRTQCV